MLHSQAWPAQYFPLPFTLYPFPSAVQRRKPTCYLLPVTYYLLYTTFTLSSPFILRSAFWPQTPLLQQIISTYYYIPLASAGLLC